MAGAVAVHRTTMAIPALAVTVRPAATGGLEVGAEREVKVVMAEVEEREEKVETGWEARSTSEGE